LKRQSIEGLETFTQYNKPQYTEISDLVTQRQILKIFYISIKNEDMPCLYISEVVCCVKSNMGNMKYNEAVHDHCRHKKSDLYIQFCRTTLFKNSSANVGIKLYNKLPNIIKRLDKVQEFKRRLKYFLLQHILD
jgi:hypothetical protein